MRPLTRASRTRMRASSRSTSPSRVMRFCWMALEGADDDCSGDAAS